MGMLLRYHTEVRPKGEAKPPPQQAPSEVPDAPEADLPAPTESEVPSDDEDSPEDHASGNSRIGDDSNPFEDGEPVTDPFAQLTDEQVAEAYATNVGGRATKRETQEAALRELDADQPTEGGSDSE